MLEICSQLLKILFQSICPRSHRCYSRFENNIGKLIADVWGKMQIAVLTVHTKCCVPKSLWVLPDCFCILTLTPKQECGDNLYPLNSHWIISHWTFSPSHHHSFLSHSKMVTTFPCLVCPVMFLIPNILQHLTEMTIFSWQMLLPFLISIIHNSFGFLPNFRSFIVDLLDSSFSLHAGVW